MDKYWGTLVVMMSETWGVTLNVWIRSILDNELCSPCRWKAIEESTAAKEWMYAVIAAEAIINDRHHGGAASKQ